MQDDMREKLIAYVFSNMADAVCITAKNGEIYSANKSAEKLSGSESLQKAGKSGKLSPSPRRTTT